MIQPIYFKDFIKFSNLETLLVFLQNDNKHTRTAALKLIHMCMKEEQFSKDFSSPTSAFVIGQKLSQQEVTQEMMCVLICMLLGKSSQQVNSNTTVFNYFINEEILDVIKYSEFINTICLALESCETSPKVKRDSLKILLNIFLFSEENKKIMLQQELPILLSKFYCEEMKHLSEFSKQEESDLLEVILSLIKTCILHISTSPPYDCVVWLNRIIVSIGGYPDISTRAKLQLEIIILKEILDFFNLNDFEKKKNYQNSFFGVFALSCACWIMKNSKYEEQIDTNYKFNEKIVKTWEENEHQFLMSLFEIYKKTKDTQFGMKLNTHFTQLLSNIFFSQSEQLLTKFFYFLMERFGDFESFMTSFFADEYFCTCFLISTSKILNSNKKSNLSEDVIKMIWSSYEILLSYVDQYPVLKLLLLYPQHDPMMNVPKLNIEELTKLVQKKDQLLVKNILSITIFEQFEKYEKEHITWNLKWENNFKETSNLNKTPTVLKKGLRSLNSKMVETISITQAQLQKPTLFKMRNLDQFDRFVTLQWKKLAKQLVHERGIWPLPISKWKQDPIEFIARTRGRLKPVIIIHNPFDCFEFQLAHVSEYGNSTLTGSDIFSETILQIQSCSLIHPYQTRYGELVFGTNIAYFIDANNDPLSKSGKLFNLVEREKSRKTKHFKSVKLVKWFYNEIKDILKRRYLLIDSALEIFLLNGKTYLITFETINERDTAYDQFFVGDKLVNRISYEQEILLKGGLLVINFFLIFFFFF